MAFYKTTTAEHKPSIGILGDLIRKHGSQSEEVAAYMARFEGEEDFCKKARLLIGAGNVVDIVGKRVEEAQKEE